MDLRIYDRNLTGGAVDANRTQEASKAGSGGSSARSSGAGAGSDQVELSGALGRLSQALSMDGAERSARVASLAEAYRSGNYQPDAAGTSHGLVAEALSSRGE